ncbi:MAG: hypothetical protein RSE29_01405 [Leclercia sp.]
MRLNKRLTRVACAAFLLAGCSGGGGSLGIGGGSFGIGGGSNGVGVGAGLSFPIGGSDVPQDTATDSAQPDCGGDVYRVPLRYPEKASGQNAKVDVSFDVKLNGRATHYSATGDKAYLQEAWRAVSRSCWRPGLHQNLTLTFNKGYEPSWSDK